MIARKIDPIEGRAEGRCCGLPYDTQLASSAGCAIHFWVGETHNPELLKKAVSVARNHRDIVYATWSHGEPTSFWANEDMPRKRDEE